MDLDKHYDIPFTHVEESVQERYHDGILRLMASKDDGESLEIVKGMFLALGESRPPKVDMAEFVDWTREITYAYKEIGKILGQIGVYNPLANLVSSSPVMSLYEGQSDEERIRHALHDLNVAVETLRSNGHVLGNLEEIIHLARESNVAHEKMMGFHD